MWLRSTAVAGNSPPKNCVARRGGAFNRDHVDLDRALLRLRSRVRAAVRLSGGGGRGRSPLLLPPRLPQGARSATAALRRQAARATRSRSSIRRAAPARRPRRSTSPPASPTAATTCCSSTWTRRATSAPRSASAASARSTTCSSRARRPKRRWCRCAATSTSSAADATLAAAEVCLARLDDGRDRVLGERLTPLMRRYALRHPRLRPVAVAAQPERAALRRRGADPGVVRLPGAGRASSRCCARSRTSTSTSATRCASPAWCRPSSTRARGSPRRRSTRCSGHFKERLYEPIRRSTRLAEAPSHRQTIFEYAPDSHGAEDYRRLVERYVARRHRRSAESPSPHAEAA